MAYNPTVWQENDLTTSERMNKIEQGIASASETPDGLLPTGGTTGQMLTKASDNYFDAEWADVPESITEDEVDSLINTAKLEANNYTDTAVAGAKVELIGTMDQKDAIFAQQINQKISSTSFGEAVVLTQAEYDELTEKDATTLYLVKEEA